MLRKEARNLLFLSCSGSSQNNTLYLGIWDVSRTRIAKKEALLLANLTLLTASNLELASMSVQRIIIKHHSTGYGDSDPERKMLFQKLSNAAFTAKNAAFLLISGLLKT